MKHNLATIKSLQNFLRKKSPILGLRIIELLIMGMLILFCIGGGVSYAVVSQHHNVKATKKDSSTGGVVGTISIGFESTPSQTKAPSTPPPQSAQTKSSSPTVSSASTYNPFDTTASPKDIYGCVLPPKNVSDVKLSGIDATLYADCIGLYKPSWCLSQVNSATSAFSTTVLQAETTYDKAKAQDEVVIQNGQHYMQQGGQGNLILGQQMVSSGNSALASDQTTYRTAYDTAYGIYSDAVLSSNQQGNCSNSIPAYQAPAY